jgi:OmpA-OmpF porin, OOP family
MKRLTSAAIYRQSICLLTAVFCLQFFSIAQAKKVASPTSPAKDSLVIPVTKADLGKFPYFNTLPNYYPTDSQTIDHNVTYFYDGKKFLPIEGMVSVQNLNVRDSKGKLLSEFECIQQFDKVVTTLGGIKIFTGKLPEDKLKTLTGQDIVSLGSKNQVAPSAFYGVVEYVLKTPEKEVWVQLQPYSLGSKFYTLLVVERKIPMLDLNTNKPNDVLQALQEGKTATLHLAFIPDEVNLETESKDEFLSIVGVFQAHPDWKLLIDVHSAPLGAPANAKALTEKRAAALSAQLQQLGVPVSRIVETGRGDEKPLQSNDTEKGRWVNTRVEVRRG